MIKLTQGYVKDGRLVEAGPVWINPWGVISIRAASGAQARLTVVRMDDGDSHLVIEAAEDVAEAVAKCLQGFEED